MQNTLKIDIRIRYKNKEKNVKNSSKIVCQFNKFPYFHNKITSFFYYICNFLILYNIYTFSDSSHYVFFLCAFFLINYFFPSASTCHISTSVQKSNFVYREKIILLPSPLATYASQALLTP